MQKLRFTEVLITVEDMDRAISFYEQLLDTKVAKRFKNRWAFLEPYINLYNPMFDLDANAELTECDKEIIWGTNQKIVFTTDDIENEYNRVNKIGVQGITNIYKINFIAKYRFFQFKDTEGNIIEIGQYI